MSSDWRTQKQYLDVHGHRIAYVEMGEGDPIVFQHGNPTSSFLWRNIMPALADRGRCIAVDLIGMGDSDKLENSGPDRYRFVEHREFLFDAWRQLGVEENVTLVLHDWGSALGFDWARQNEDAVAGIAYMEAIVRPMSWAEWPDAARGIFEAFRSEAGEELILERNLFIERVLPGSILRALDEEEMEEYRRPFTQSGEDRRPTLTWPRQIPLDGEPDDVVGIVADYSAWLESTPIPKLFVNADPGAILIGPQRDYCRRFPNQSEITVPGLHFIQEDSADAIAAGIRDWMSDA